MKDEWRIDCEKCGHPSDICIGLLCVCDASNIYKENAALKKRAKSLEGSNETLKRYCVSYEQQIVNLRALVRGIGIDGMEGE